MPLEHARLPHHRRAGLHADRPGGRSAAWSIRSCGRKAAFNPKTRLERQRARPDAGDARRRQDTSPRNSTSRSTRSACSSDAAYNVADRLGRARRRHQGLSRLLHLAFAAYNAGRGRVKEWIEQVRRPARSQGRSDRLGRAHPVLGDAQLRPARHGEHAGLSRPLRRRLAAADRGRPAPRRKPTLPVPVALRTPPLRSASIVMRILIPIFCRRGLG